MRSSIRCMGSCVSGGARPTLFIVNGAVTHAVEFAVGLGCVVIAVPKLARRRLRWLGAVLLVAGVAAIVHAAVRLLS